MFDLPSVRKEAYEKLTQDILHLRRGGSKGKDKPHKLIMLLAVFDLIDKGEITENKILLNDSLINSFETIFSLVCNSEDWCQPGPPFFHLRSSGFWNLKVIEGREEQYSKLQTSGGGLKRIKDNVEYAYFSEYAYHIVCDIELRKALKKLIISLINPSSSVNKAGISNLFKSSRWNVKKQRIGTMFHEKFPLSRSALALILNMLFQKTSSPEEMKCTRIRYNIVIGGGSVEGTPPRPAKAATASAREDDRDVSKTQTPENPDAERVISLLARFHNVSPEAVSITAMHSREKTPHDITYIVSYALHQRQQPTKRLVGWDFKRPERYNWVYTAREWNDILREGEKNPPPAAPGGFCCV